MAGSDPDQEEKSGDVAGSEGTIRDPDRQRDWKAAQDATHDEDRTPSGIFMALTGGPVQSFGIDGDLDERDTGRKNATYDRPAVPNREEQSTKRKSEELGSEILIRAVMSDKTFDELYHLAVERIIQDYDPERLGWLGQYVPITIGGRLDADKGKREFLLDLLFLRTKAEPTPTGVFKQDFVDFFPELTAYTTDRLDCGGWPA